MADLVKDMDGYLRGKGLPTNQIDFKTTDGMASFGYNPESGKVEEIFKDSSAEARAKFLYADYQSRVASLDKTNAVTSKTIQEDKGLHF